MYKVTSALGREALRDSLNPLIQDDVSQLSPLAAHLSVCGCQVGPRVLAPSKAPAWVENKQEPDTPGPPKGTFRPPMFSAPPHPAWHIHAGQGEP